jgi:hypothetical protein
MDIHHLSLRPYIMAEADLVLKLAYDVLDVTLTDNFQYHGHSVDN